MSHLDPRAPEARAQFARNDDSLLGAVGVEVGLDRTALKSEHRELDGGSGDSLLPVPRERESCLSFQRRVRERCLRNFPPEPRSSAGYIVDQRLEFPLIPLESTRHTILRCPAHS